MLYNNINGYQSKSESFHEAVDKIKPEIIVLCETKAAQKNTLKKDFIGYDLITKQIKKGKGGILCGVKKQLGALSVLEVTTGSNENLLSVKISFPKWSLRVVVAYGPQENDTIEKKEEFFSDLEIEVEACKVNGDKLIVVGDLNSKIEMRNGELKALSSNGKFLINIINARKLQVLNFSDKCAGKWTHVIRTSNTKSVIDYILVDEEVESDVTEVIIDEECFYTPFRRITEKGVVTAQYSDHNTIITKFKVEVSTQKEKTPNEEISQSWMLNEDGWKKFTELTEESTCEICPVSDSNDEYNKFEKYILSVMNSCFKRRKTNRKNRWEHQSKDERRIYKILRSYMKQGKIQRKVARVYVDIIKENNLKIASEKRLDKVNSTLSRLTMNDKLSHSGFWKLRRSINLKNEVGTSVVLKNGVELFGSSVIREAYKEEFKHRLRKRTIDCHLQEYEDLTYTLCNLYHEVGKSEGDLVFNESDLKSVIKSLKSNKAPGPDGLPAEVFIHAGKGLVKNTVDMFNNIKRNACIPVKWNKVNIKTLYKNKGSIKDLENHRGVFLTPTVCKLFERYLMKNSKQNIDRISKLQGGSRPNRSASDQLFLIRACIDHAKYTKRCIFIKLYDFTQCFDGMWLEDSIISLKDIGIPYEVLSLIKNLNTTSEIIVKTPVGNTPSFTVKNIVKQGTVLGPTLCSASTAECCDEHVTGGVSIGSTSIKSLAYVDDILDADEDADDASDSHNTVLEFTSKKRLELSWKKCALLVINSTKKTKIPKLPINGKPIKREVSAKYLGDFINEKGSNTDLIADRVKKGDGCCVNILAMVQDINFGSHTIETVLLLYNAIFIATVLYNAQSWSRITNNEMKKLKVCQMSLLKRVLKTPASSPNAVVQLELGVIPIEYEIFKKRLMFLQHILKLGDTDPVNKVYHEQRKYEHEQNWANEVEELRQKMNIDISNESIKSISKGRWKKIVDDSIKEAARRKLNSDCGNLKKVTRTYIELKAKEYLFKLPVEDARIVFAFRSGALDLKCNRKWKYKDTLCRACGNSEEDLNHIINVCDSRERLDCLDLESENLEVLKSIVQRIKTFTTIIERD